MLGLINDECCLIHSLLEQNIGVPKEYIIMKMFAIK